MSDIALPGSIEPARGPRLDHEVSPLTLILFFGGLAAGILLVAYSIYTDINATGTKISNYLPLLLLFVALLIALGFEFVNGFHDTANAMAASIATLASIGFQAVNFTTLLAKVTILFLASDRLIAGRTVAVAAATERGLLRPPAS